MYVKRIQLTNYGPINQLDIECPFDAKKPKPVVLVGENGSGKSILLSHIVNGLLVAQQVAYPENPEVDEGRVYKHRSPFYVQAGKEASFSRVDFESDLYASELLLRQRKRAYKSIPEDVSEESVQDLWDGIGPMNSSGISANFNAKKAAVKEIFSTHCILYFPANRFEDPAWLNERNLKAKAQYTKPVRREGYTDRRIINYSPLDSNENWVFDVAYDVVVFERRTHLEDISHKQHNDSRVTRPRSIFELFMGKSTSLFDTIQQIAQTIMPHIKGAQLRFGGRSERFLSITDNDKRYVPNIFQLSSGEVSLLNMFLSILRDYDLCGVSFDKPENIRGIVVVDEIDLHLHAQHQYEVLPRLMEMFPRVQFVVTTHSPLFVLGVQKILGADGFVVHGLPHGRQISPEDFGEFDKAYQAFSNTQRHSDVVATEIRNSQRPIVFVDGKTDVKYLTSAIELLGLQKTFQDVDIRDGAGQLKNIWKGLTKDHVEHKAVVLLHDCDDKVEPDERENVFRWTIPQIKSHPIRNGIENRFNKETLEKAKKHKRAFIDIKGKHLVTNRGVDEKIPEEWSVNDHEKTNLCNWFCEEGRAEDFEHFREIFKKLSEILGRFQPTSDKN